MNSKVVLEKVEALKLELSTLKTRSALKKRSTYQGFPGAPELKVQAGQLIEVLGKGAWVWVIQFLKANPEVRVVFLSLGPLELFPVAVAQESLALSRLLFLEKVATPKGMSTLLTLLRSKLFQVVVFEQAFLSRRLDLDLRKLQIASEDSQALMIMFSQKATSSFGVYVQIDTESKIQLKKVKGGTSAYE